jgi:hypothetical protein
MELIFVLRNLVHEQPLRCVQTDQDIFGRGREFRAGVGRPEQERLGGALQRLGQPSDWGFSVTDDEWMTLDLYRYGEVALPRALEILDRMLELTDVSRLNGGQEVPPGSFADGIGDDFEFFQHLIGVG